MSKELLIYSSLGGLVPALLWLWFWLKEDSKHPEPKRILIATFVGGMFAVLPAIFLQVWVDSSLADRIEDFFQNFGLLIFLGGGLGLVMIHAAIEEIVKLGMCYFTALRKKDDDEPIDSVIYLITAALGFAAVENTLFILSGYLNSPEGYELISSILVGNIRFVGASLLHVTTSAIIGIAIALAFKRKAVVKIIFALGGLIVAIILHTYFNSLIINKDYGFLLSFPLVWMAIVALILSLEKIKKMDV